MITLHQGNGGLPFIHVENEAAQAEICLLGATVTEFQPTGHRPVLWTSPNSRFAVGAPMYAGIPVCWPWFGPALTPGLPNHGFVRTQMWEIQRVEEELARSTVVEMACRESEATLKLWPYAFELRLTARVGEELQVSLEMSNTGAQTFPVSAALHTYFSISDIENITIGGLEKVTYLSKLHNYQEFTESSAVRINRPADRVYIDTEATCTIDDPAWQRRIVVEKSGSRTTVVWNAGAERSAAMADLGEGVYRHYVCVESVIGPREERTLAPGQQHTLSTRIRAEQF